MMINNIVVIATFICFIFSLGAIIFFKQKSIRYWNNLNLGSIVIIIFIFIIPSLIFIETNFGLIDTIKYSISSKEIKLSKIKGWGNRYNMINYLNNLPKQSNFLFINSPYELMAIHLDIPSKNIVFFYNIINFSNRIFINIFNISIANIRGAYHFYRLI